MKIINTSSLAKTINNLNTTMFDGRKISAAEKRKLLYGFQEGRV